MQRADDTEYEDRAGDEEQRRKSAGQWQLAQRRGDRNTADRAGHATDAELQRELARQRHAAEILRSGEITREQSRQQHGDRIVRARLDFECRTDTRTQLQAAIGTMMRMSRNCTET